MPATNGGHLSSPDRQVDCCRLASLSPARSREFRPSVEALLVAIENSAPASRPFWWRQRYSGLRARSPGIPCGPHHPYPAPRSGISLLRAPKFRVSFRMPIKVDGRCSCLRRAGVTAGPSRLPPVACWPRVTGSNGRLCTLQTIGRYPTKLRITVNRSNLRRSKPPALP